MNGGSAPSMSWEHPREGLDQISKPKQLLANKLGGFFCVYVSSHEIAKSHRES